MDDPAALVGAGPVLCLAPHPDDESLGCGALLAACWRGGIAAHVACLTDGAASHRNSALWRPRRIAALRREEMAAAVAILGGDPARDLTHLGHPDARLHQVDPDRLASQIGRLLAGLGSRVLLAPSERDAHCDHVAAAAAARAVRAARPDLRLLSYPVWSRWADRDGVHEDPGPGRHTFDAPGLRAVKANAIAAHASQRGAVIGDDPSGFVMPDGFAAMFADGPEIFDERAA